jgi:hypothetical protein
MPEPPAQRCGACGSAVNVAPGVASADCTNCGYENVVDQFGNIERILDDDPEPDPGRNSAMKSRAGWAIFLKVIGGVATAFGVLRFSQTGGGITPMLLLGIGLLLLSFWVRPDQPDRIFPPIPPRPDQVANSSRERWLPQGFVVERESRDWILGRIGSEAHTMSKRTGVLEKWPSYPDALTRFTSRSQGDDEEPEA